MSNPADAPLRRAEPRVGRERRTISQSIPSIADPAHARRDQIFFWSLIGTAIVATFGLIVRGERDGVGLLALRIVTLFSTSMALMFSVRAALTQTLDRETRRCWLSISTGLLLVLGVLFMMVVAKEYGWQPQPGMRSSVVVLAQVAAIFGLLQLPGAPRAAIDKFKLLLDTATVVVGGAIVAFYDITTLPADNFVTVIGRHTSVALDLVILLIASIIWRQTTNTTRGHSIGFFAGGIFIHLVSMMVLLFDRRLETESTWPLSTGSLVVSLIAVAAWVQSRGVSKGNRVTNIAFRTGSATSTLIPYVAVLPSFALLLRTTSEQGIQPLGGLAVGAVLLAGLAFARQVASARETIRLSKESIARDGEARFRALVQHSSDVITIIDPDSTIRYISPSVAGVFGYQPTHLEGLRLTSLIHPDDVDGALSFFEELARSTGPGPRPALSMVSGMKREWRIRHADDSWHTVDNVGTNLLDEQVIGGLVLNTRDVTEQSVIREQYMHQAFHDPLTDLANRSLFLYQVGHALARTQRQGHKVTVLFLDLDNFKNVNDSLGHAAGDRLLVEAARRLAACVRDSDVIARLGGDEFAVLLEDANDEATDIDVIADRIGTTLASPFNLGGKEVFVSASIGIARTTAGETSDELVRNADVAMYVAKTNGKGKHVVFEPEMHRAALERLGVEADLRRAIEREEFFLQFQPIVLLQTGEICGAEALVRWQCRERGVVPPGVFIHIAEETGLVVPLGRMVLRSACKAAYKWTRDHGRPLRVTVNLSGRQLQEADIIDHVREALEESNLPPHYLVLEITESMLMQNTDLSMARLTALKALGVSLAIDDFGTGYSSLSYLQRYPIDILKIDKAFTEAIDKGGDGPVLASAIVALGETLRMSTVAEGIETEAQRGHLLQLGCELGQGFLFAPPLGIEDFTRLILAKGLRSPLNYRRRLVATEQAA